MVWWRSMIGENGRLLDGSSPWLGGCPKFRLG
jgi:hypothetical protein